MKPFEPVENEGFFAICAPNPFKRRIGVSLHGDLYLCDLIRGGDRRAIRPRMALLPGQPHHRAKRPYEWINGELIDQYDQGKQR